MHCVVITVQQGVYRQRGKRSLPIAGSVDQTTDVELTEEITPVVHLKWLNVKYETLVYHRKASEKSEEVILFVSYCKMNLFTFIISLSFDSCMQYTKQQLTVEWVC